jgi:putative transposase
VFCVDVPEERLEPTGRQVGIDLGVRELLATSDGELVANPRWIGAARKQIGEAQRLVSGRRHGSARRAKAASRVAAVHRRLARKRRDHHHKLSRRLVDRSDLIAHERLAIANLLRRPSPRPNNVGGHDSSGAAAKAGLNREIQSAGWGQLLRMIAYKAEEAGRTVIAVNPRQTSQACHNCGHVDAANRNRTAFRCTHCGHEAHADINAARNILRAGLAHRPEREAA